MTYEQLFNILWLDYTVQNPQAKKIYELFRKEGEDIENDHIAFRTFNDSRINIDALSKIFISIGYSECGNYRFEEKHLFAKHFEHKTNKNAPRVFISELILEDFSEYLQKNCREAVDKIPSELLKSEEIIYMGNVWGVPSFKVYEKLREESEYAAWLYVNGFRANHFTVSINSLKKYNTIEKVNQFLKDNGFVLNSSGGEIKGTKEELLQQSSVMADILPFVFSEGTYKIPSCYYEFAIRYPDKNGELYSGFIAKSADKIFESTNFYKN